MVPGKRALLLDVDGVLVTPPDWFGLCIRREVPEFAAGFFDGPFLAATRGEIDLAQHLSDLIGATGRDCTPEAFLAEWHEYENHPNRLLWEPVEKLRADGWPVYLATNQERHRMRHLMEAVGLGAIVDGEFASCSVGHRKPTPEYYVEVTRRLGLPPADIVFFDDAEENVLAAREAGWSAHLFCGVESFVSVMFEPTV